MISRVIKIVFIFLFCILSFDIAAQTTEDYMLHIDRKAKELYVLRSDSSILWKAPCGIGRGELKEKKNMSDNITPTGKFTIDIILYKNPKFDKVSDGNIDKYKNNGRYSRFLSSNTGLNELFGNMNGIDFNSDGKPDQSYGSAYIGLDSKNSVTGPKLADYKGMPYWFSIAMHGTPDETNIGKANSGGCIHLGETTLSRLVEEGIVKIGTKVSISDEPPK